MTQDEESLICGQIGDVKQDIALLRQDLVGRVKFLEKIVFGFIGVIVLGVIATIGGVVLWAIAAMAEHHQAP